MNEQPENLYAEAETALKLSQMDAQIAGIMRYAHEIIEEVKQRKYYQDLVETVKGRKIVITGVIRRKEQSPRYNGEQPAGLAYRPTIEGVSGLEVIVEDAQVLEHPDDNYQSLPWVWCRTADVRGLAGVLGKRGETGKLRWEFKSEPKLAED